MRRGAVKHRNAKFNDLNRCAELDHCRGASNRRGVHNNGTALGRQSPSPIRCGPRDCAGGSSWLSSSSIFLCRACKKNCLRSESQTTFMMEELPERKRSRSRVALDAIFVAMADFEAALEEEMIAAAEERIRKRTSRFPTFVSMLTSGQLNQRVGQTSNASIGMRTKEKGSSKFGTQRRYLSEGCDIDGRNCR